MISFEDALDEKPLKLYSKKIDFKSGIPEQIDGPVKVIYYENKMPLDIELGTLLIILSGVKPKISNIRHGYEVVKTLVDANQQILDDTKT